MKKVLFLIFINVLIGQVKGQTLEAKYSVSKEILMDIDNKQTKIADIKSTGLLYRDKNRYIYYEKPDYLQKYPEGVVTVPTKSGTASYALSSDTIQRLNFHDLDSLVRIYRPDIKVMGNDPYNVIDKIGRVKFKIEYLDETKEINGLFCQKANLSISGYSQWIVWFAPSIPVDVNVFNIINLPGLVVEAEMVPLKIKYLLQTYEIGKSIDERIFHPKELEDRYQDPFGNKTNKKADKVNKQLELRNGN